MQKIIATAMEQQLVGRKYEWDLLNEVMNSSESEMVIVYGRRRVGKTFLVNKFFDNTYAFKHTGVFNKQTRTQLERFTASLEDYSGETISVPENWYKAFDMLKAYLRTVKSDKRVVFIDEMPWLDTADSDFVSALESFWNGWASAEDNIVLVACGSATSWLAFCHK